MEGPRRRTSPGPLAVPPPSVPRPKAGHAHARPVPAPFPAPRTLLSDDLLEQIRGRAAAYDRDNAFFTEDLAALTEAGYLRALVPESFGGAGLTLREVAHEQARLAGAAPRRRSP